MSRHAKLLKRLASAPARIGLSIRLEFDLTIVEGADPTMNATIGEIQQEARIILEDGGAAIAEDARARARVKTGALRASIYYRVEDVTGLTLGATVPYAIYQEYGTRRMAAHAFLLPSINEHQPMIQEQLDQMIAEKLAVDSSVDDPEFEFYRTMEELESAGLEE